MSVVAAVATANASSRTGLRGSRVAAAAAHSTPARMISAAGEGKNGSPATPELDAGEPTDAGDASDAASPGPWSTRPGSKRAWIRANGEKVWRALTAADAALLQGVLCFALSY